MSLTGRLFGPERRGATGPWGDSSIPRPGPAAGAPVTEDRALQVITVLACVSLLADAVSTLPLFAYVRGAEAREPVEPAPQLIMQPFSELTLQDWLTQVMVSLTLRGNFYGLVVQRDEVGFATQIWPLHPDQVSVRRSERDGTLEYRVNGSLVSTDDMVHIPAVMLPGALVGLNPIECARVTLGLARSAEAFSAGFFENSAQPSGVITVPGSMGKDETRTMALDWIAAHQGSGNAHLPAVLTGGATWTQLSINPDDAQFIETRNLSRLEIAMMFRVPPHMLGDVDRTTSWGTGIEQQEIGFVTNTLRAWLTRIEAHLSALLPPQIMCKFNLAGRLRGDTLQRFQAYTMGRAGGWLNVDEIREKEDEPPLADGLGQGYLQPLNYAPLGSDPATPPASPADGPSQRSTFDVLLEHLTAPKTRTVERDSQGRAVRLVESNGHGSG